MDNLQFGLLIGLLLCIGSMLWHILRHMKHDDLNKDLAIDVKRQNIYLNLILFQLRSQDTTISEDRNENFRYQLETKLGCLDYLPEDVDEYLDERNENRPKYD